MNHLGDITRPAASAFPQDKINDILDKRRHVRIKPTDRIDEIVCTIDPNGGGASRTAVMIGYLNKRTDNIVVNYFFLLHKNRNTAKKRQEGFKCIYSSFSSWRSSVTIISLFFPITSSNVRLAS